MKASGSADRPDATLQEKADAIEWYHTMDLPGGVRTVGTVDLRLELPQYKLPEDMTGLRALDVATFDGYWAFEMERRGASVVAIDLPSFGEIDLPMRWKEQMKPEEDVKTGAGFFLAKEAFGSNVDRREISVYDLSPEAVGTFDFVFLSDLIQHLRDPQKALEAIYTVMKPGAIFVMGEVYDPVVEKLGEPLLLLKAYAGRAWAHPSVSALRLMLEIAGFREIEEVSRPALLHLGSYSAQKVVLKARR